MLDISFGELLLIGGVALLVLGPERLPEVARTVGALVARLQRFVASVKSDISQQANLDDLAQLRADVHATARQFTDQLESEVRALQTPILAVPEIDPAMPAPVAGHTVAEGTVPGADAPPARDENQPDLFAELLPPAGSQVPAATPHHSPTSGDTHQ